MSNKTEYIKIEMTRCYALYLLIFRSLRIIIMLFAGIGANVNSIS